MWQFHFVDWDVSAWLHVPEGADIESKGSSGVGGGCWNSIFRQSGFVDLSQKILQHPAHIVMLQLRHYKP